MVMMLGGGRGEDMVVMVSSAWSCGGCEEGGQIRDGEVRRV